MRKIDLYDIQKLEKAKKLLLEVYEFNQIAETNRLLPIAEKIHKFIKEMSE